MKKIILIILVLAIVGIAYRLASPLFINKKVIEKIEDIAPQGNVNQVETTAAGTFVGLEGHTAQGTAKLIKNGSDYFVRLEDDFRVTNGPDLFVYLGKNGAYDPKARLGELKGNIGSQNYAIPSSLNVSDYDEVWVWCWSFSVAFGKAVLK